MAYEVSACYCGCLFFTVLVIVAGGIGDMIIGFWIGGRLHSVLNDSLYLSPQCVVGSQRLLDLGTSQIDIKIRERPDGGSKYLQFIGFGSDTFPVQAVPLHEWIRNVTGVSLDDLDVVANTSVLVYPVPVLSANGTLNRIAIAPMLPFHLGGKAGQLMYNGIDFCSYEQTRSNVWYEGRDWLPGLVGASAIQGWALGAATAAVAMVPLAAATRHRCCSEYDGCTAPHTERGAAAALLAAAVLVSAATTAGWVLLPPNLQIAAPVPLWYETVSQRDWESFVAQVSPEQSLIISLIQLQRSTFLLPLVLLVFGYIGLKGGSGTCPSRMMESLEEARSDPRLQNACCCCRDENDRVEMNLPPVYNRMRLLDRSLG